MSTFGSRLRLASATETEATERLRDAGYVVGQFGQAMLPQEVREQLRHSESDLRWLPDLIAIRGTRELLVDAKTSARSDTPNYSIELRAHRAHLALMSAYGVPVVYYFTGGSANYAALVRIETMFDGRGTGGSGTPFLLARKAEQQAFEVIFGDGVACPTADWWRVAAQRELAGLQALIASIFGPTEGGFWRGGPK
jgi:hypothetical protein